MCVCVCVCVCLHEVPPYSRSANILLSSDWTPKLGDFGVARIIPSEMSSLMTTTVVGTSIFMAPEYRTGTITPATDMYALGVVRLCVCVGG